MSEKKMNQRELGKDVRPSERADTDKSEQDTLQTKYTDYHYPDAGGDDGLPF